MHDSEAYIPRIPQGYPYYRGTPYQAHMAARFASTCAVPSGTVSWCKITTASIRYCLQTLTEPQRPRSMTMEMSPHWRSRAVAPPRRNE